MRRMISIYVVGLAVAAFAAQDTFTLDRKYKVDERDSYKVAASLEMTGGSGEASMTLMQTVVKTYENGDADIALSSKDARFVMDGQEMIEELEEIVVRVDKRGLPASASEHGPLSGVSTLLSASGLVDKPMKTGETLKVDIEAKDGRPKAKGTVKLESVKDGVATIVSDMDVTSDEFDGATCKLTATALIDVATSKPNKIELKCLFADAGFEIKSIKATIERIK